MKRWIALATAFAMVVAACGDDSTDTTVPAVLPTLPAADTFTTNIDNPYWPMQVGSRWVYRTTVGEDIEDIVVEVLGDTRSVAGITAVVLRDVVSLDGSVIEDTLDWYGQDAAGNVWYLGEDSKEMEDGEVVSTAGSWETGVDGAQAGIIMYADPISKAGEAYFQEFYEGEAEDQARVLRIEPSVTVAAGTFTDVLVIEEWNPFEPGIVEEKYYAPGVGVILEEKVQGETERVELVSFESG